MQTFGFTCGYSGIVTLDVTFSTVIDGATYPVVSSYLFMPSTASEGGIVYVNSAGETMWWPYAVLGYNPIAATQVLTSAFVNGIPRNTTAMTLAWAGSVYS